MAEKWVKMVTGNGETNITSEFSRLQFLDFVEEDVQTTTNTLEIKGRDGVLAGPSTFAPFKLSLRFVYVGQDVKDYHLYKTRLRQMIYKREPYYIIISDMPGRKYAVLPSAISFDDKYAAQGECTIEFSVIKGYSESLKDTSDITFLTDYWQFENGIITDDIAYEFDRPRFSVWNGSSDEIDALMGHNLVIEIKANAPNGLKIVNHMTGDEFRYYKSMNGTLELNGVHPYVNGSRAGINTNYEYIKLQSGWNNIEIDGSGMTLESVKFKFNFIFR